MRGAFESLIGLAGPSALPAAVCHTMKSAAGRRWQHPALRRPNRPRWQENHGWKNSLDTVPRWTDSEEREVHEGKEGERMWKNYEAVVNPQIWIVMFVHFEKTDDFTPLWWKLKTVKSLKTAGK